MKRLENCMMKNVKNLINHTFFMPFRFVLHSAFSLFVCIHDLLIKYHNGASEFLSATVIKAKSRTVCSAYCLYTYIYNIYLHFSIIHTYIRVTYSAKKMLSGKKIYRNFIVSFYCCCGIVVTIVVNVVVVVVVSSS